MAHQRQPDEVIELRTRLELKALAGIFKNTIDDSIKFKEKARGKLEWARPERNHSDPFSSLDQNYDFEAVAGFVPRGAATMGVSGIYAWALHLYADDRGTHREAQIVHFSAPMWRSMSDARLKSVVDALIGADPALETGRGNSG